MNLNSVLDIFFNATQANKECNIQIWVGPNGIFHKGNDFPNDDCPNEEEINCCGLSYSNESNEWIVTPWLYNADCAVVLKKAMNARQMAYFWLDWMGYLYGDDGIDNRRFEADWLLIKSNRSLLMMLFSQEGEQLKRELWKDETGEDIPITHGPSKYIVP
jgi:hypothetical protein